MAGWLSLRRRSASLAAVVVLPEPCSPHEHDDGRRRLGPLQADRLAAQYFPQLLVDDLHHGLAGRQGGEYALAVRRSLTLLTNCRVTLKSTSASSSAMRTSRIAASTSLLERRP